MCRSLLLGSLSTGSSAVIWPTRVANIPHTRRDSTTVSVCVGSLPRHDCLHAPLVASGTHKKRALWRERPQALVFIHSHSRSYPSKLTERGLDRLTLRVPCVIFISFHFVATTFRQVSSKHIPSFFPSFSVSQSVSQSVNQSAKVWISPAPPAPCNPWSAVVRPFPPTL